MNQGAREDLPTGKTPTKRVHYFADHWELTKSRDLLLKDRARYQSPADDDTLQEVDPDPESSRASDLLDEEDPVQLPTHTEQPVLRRDAPSIPPPGWHSRTPSVESTTDIASELPLPLTSSASSVGVIPLTLPPKKAKNVAGKTHIGTLTERSTNVLANRPRKAR